MRALACLLLVAGAAHAEAPAIAVMPWKDLAGGRGAIGEAIRETVTSDLREVREVRVIERGAIDRVLVEQDLQARRADLDPLATVRLGRLVGATMIVTGAYQRVGATVRLTARFVRVETGEVVGSAKVDGPASDLLALQDRITVELLRSAGLQAAAAPVAARRPPRLRRVRAVELYGDAVVEPDDGKRGEILRLALAEDPTFTYAVKDLAALEQRIKGYAADADAAQARAQRELKAQLVAERDPLKRAQIQMALLGQLMQGRRYHQLLAEARAALADPPRPAPPGNVRFDETAGFYVLQAELFLKRRDALLADGERFMKAYPASPYFKAAESMVQAAILERRREEEGKTAAPARVAELATQARWDLCTVATVYERAAQHAEAQRLFRACLELGAGARVEALSGLVGAEIEQGDFAAARRDLRLLEAERGERAEQARRALEQRIPSDG